MLRRCATRSGDGGLDVAEADIHPFEPWIDNAPRGPASRDCCVCHASLGKACEASEAIANHLASRLQGFSRIAFGRLFGKARNQAELDEGRLTVTGLDSGEKRGLTLGATSARPLSFA